MYKIYVIHSVERFVNITQEFYFSPEIFTVIYVGARNSIWIQDIPIWQFLVRRNNILHQMEYDCQNKIFLYYTLPLSSHPNLSSLCLYSIFIRQTFEMELCLHTNKWTDVDGTEEHKKDERMLNSMSTFLWIVNILFITWFHLFIL